MFRVQSIEEGKLVLEFSLAPKSIPEAIEFNCSDRYMAIAKSRLEFKNWFLSQSCRYIKYSQNAHKEALENFDDKKVFAVLRIDAFVAYSMKNTDRFDIWIGFAIEIEKYYRRILPEFKNAWRRDLEKICNDLMQQLIEQRRLWIAESTKPLKIS